MSLNSTMEVNGLFCDFNSPEALKSRYDNEGNEVSQSLPPYNSVKAYPVDEYPGCPGNWMHGNSNASSYFVPVQVGKGMWLDFNECWQHNYDVAVVVSVQGVNPITGQKQNKLCLEQYQNKCPIHGQEFQQDRYCPDCEYKWPAQNYITTTAQGRGRLWIDGFRSQDGRVQQYIFTEEELRGIAHQLIGDEKVYAIGIAFFLSKKPKPQKVDTSPLRSPWNDIVIGGSDITPTPNWYCPKPEDLDWHKWDQTKFHYYTRKMYMTNSMNSDNTNYATPQSLNHVTSGDNMDGVLRDCADYMGDELKNSVDESKPALEEKEQKTVEIGAGAAISQRIDPDPNDLSYWQEEPAGFIYINYVSQEDAQKIIDHGKRQDKQQGFMDGLRVGN